jgi:hypothetical protein
MASRATTLGDLTIGALERLFNALPQCGRACVVVTNLKDDVYLDGSGLLRTLIDNLSKQYDRNATAITPVQQNTGEVYEIVRSACSTACRRGSGDCWYWAEKGADPMAPLMARRVACDSRAGCSRSPTFLVW